MLKKKIFLAACFGLSAAVFGADAMKTGMDADGRTYQYAEKDPFQVRIYRLSNGMTVYLSRNPAEPVINLMTAVRAGSIDEPSAATGLAHYFEHMMFKGTDRLGALDWSKEKPLLERLEQLFEQRRNTQDPELRKKLYAEIDSVSSQAAKYASPGEFSKLASSIGADNLNAATSYDFTMYVARIPSNELGRYLKLEQERFRNPVLRLFHTELETVYEEFNRCQDSDSRRSFAVLMSELFKGNPLGRAVIGLPEHIKAPSMKDIQTFYRKWYVPGNMAVMLTGDLNYEKTMALLEKTLGSFPDAGVPERVQDPVPALNAPVKAVLFGPESENIRIAWRFPQSPETSLLANLVTRLLCDNGYGIFDQKLVRARKVMSAASYMYETGGHTILLMEGTPLQNQSLEEVEQNMLGILNELSEGRFEDWRISAVAENIRVQLAGLRSDNSGELNSELLSLWLSGMPYTDLIHLADRTEQITKQRVADFVKQSMKNRVSVYKTTGKADHILKVEKPPITPVEVKSGENSAYAEEFLALPAPAVEEPENLEGSALTEKRLPGGRRFIRVNRDFGDGLFNAVFVSKRGKVHDPFLPVILGYMEFLGTDRYSAEGLRQEFYKLGVRMKSESNIYQTQIALDGPAAKYPEALALLDHFMRNAKPDQKIWNEYIARILKKRENDKKNPQMIFQSAAMYAWYGPQNPFREDPSEAQLKSANPEELIAGLRELYAASSTDLVYSGPAPAEEAAKAAEQILTVPAPAVPHRKIYPLRDTGKPVVWLADFDKVQLTIALLSSAGEFRPENMAFAGLLNEYFFDGLDAVVFQEIRESRALAYSAGGSLILPMEKAYPERVYLVLGTQPDKSVEAVSAAKGLLADMPFHPAKFQAAKASVLKKLSADRKFGLEVYDFFCKMERAGIRNDWRRQVYRETLQMSPEEFQRKFREKIAGKNADLVIVGRPSAELLKQLSRFGEIRKLSGADLFGE